MSNDFRLILAKAAGRGVPMPVTPGARQFNAARTAVNGDED
jgi:hypothetical protein